jgi:hypothetical protein
MAFKSGAVAIGTTDTDVITCPATLNGAVVLLVSNVSGGAATYTVKHYKQSTGLTTAISGAVSIAANTPAKFPIPISMEAGDKIVMLASAGGAIVAYATATVSAATPAATGFTPRGAWSSIATYAANDCVSYTDGNSYVSIQNSNTNQNPVTQTAYWMLLASINLPTGTSGHAVPFLDGKNIWTYVQAPSTAALTSGAAADFSTNQCWTINVNGSTFTAANPSAPPPNGAYVTMLVTFTTANGLGFGNKYKTTGYVASTSGKDHLVFKYDSVADLYYLVGVRNGVAV